jgi:predicted ABC-type ATPase
MFANGRSFVTETVFSHPSKLDLIEKARGLGYNVIVMQVGVESADLSVARVKERSDEGGHDVPEDKIRARFDRCLPLIREAVHIADVGQVFDNSTLGKPPRRVVTFSKGLLVFVDPELPRWVLDVYAADLSLLRRDT